MSGLPILYSFRRCPYAMRARLGLWASGTAVELREIVLRDKPPSMLEASPKGTVPVLILADRVIDESRDIAEWALAQNDPLGWLDTHSPQKAALIDRNDGPFKAALDRYKYPGRFDLDDEGRMQARANAANILHDLDALLAGSAYLNGEAIGWVDHAIAPFVRQFAHVDRDWFRAQDWPHLMKWLDAFLVSPQFDAIMFKRPAWREGDPPYVFVRETDT